MDTRCTTFVAILTLCIVGTLRAQTADVQTATKSNERGRRELQAGSTVTNSIGMELIYCPRGRFRMGGPKGADHTDVDEHEVDVELTRGFFLGKYEVTQKEWKEVMETEPWKRRINVREGDRQPVSHILWEDAEGFCKKLSEREKKTYRLPTEAEWEYACRAGTKTQQYFADPKTIREHAWYAMNTTEAGKGYPQHVGLKKPNPWGFYDMYGNVEEFCLDSYSERIVGGVDPLIRLQDRKFDLHRVCKGGSCYSIFGCRSPARSPNMLSTSDWDLGFRVCLLISDAEAEKNK
jgi:formylglycine-generating enzyme required for sulfatase activity